MQIKPPPTLTSISPHLSQASLWYPNINTYFSFVHSIPTLTPISPSSVSGISLISQKWHPFPPHLSQASLWYPNIDTNFSSSVSGISLISQHWHQFPIICFRHTPLFLWYPNIDTNFPSSVSGIHPCLSGIPTLTPISHHLSQVYTPVCLVSQH